MLNNPLFAGEINGSICPGMEINNSPSELAKQSDTSRPLILLSTSGTRLIANAGGSDALYLACFRNSLSMGCRLISEKHPRVALVGAGSRGEFREEDRLCAARIARVLVEGGHDVSDRFTAEVLEQWGTAADDAFLGGRSASYLRETAQEHDLEFVLEHIDDLSSTYRVANGEVTELHAD